MKEKSICCVKKIEILSQLHKTGLVLMFYPCQKAPPCGWGGGGGGGERI